jgi:hypothetical protein
MSGNLIQLPMGDLWRAPEVDPETGEHKQRADTINSAGLENRARASSKDVEAILMAELEAGRRVAAPPPKE